MGQEPHGMQQLSEQQTTLFIYGSDLLLAIMDKIWIKKISNLIVMDLKCKAPGKDTSFRHYGKAALRAMTAVSKFLPLLVQSRLISFLPKPLPSSP